MKRTYPERLSNRIVNMYLKRGSVWYKQYCKLIEMVWEKYGKAEQWTNRR